MKSVLLQQVSRVLVPLALAVGVALLLKGHDEPGGGFVAGLALGMAGVLALAAYGLRYTRLALSAEVGAVVGIALTVVSLLLPLLGGDAMLTHASGTLPILGKWHGALLFDVGVMLAVGCGSMAAAQALWATPANGDQAHGKDPATRREET